MRVDDEVRQGADAKGYEWRMVVLTSLAIATISFDRLANGYLGPFLVADLHLTKTQLGSVYSVQAVAVALFGLAAGRLSDRLGRRKGLLVPLLVAAGACAAATLFAANYARLLVARLASGVALAGISPISQSIVSEQSRPARLGRNLGLQTLIMLVVSQMIGPILLPRVAERLGWQAAFATAAIPYLLLAGAVLLFLREPPRVAASPAAETGGEAPAIDPQARRGIALCLGIAALFMIWLVVHSTFLSIFLVEQRGLTPTQAGLLQSELGLAGAIGGLGLPMLSDRIGRRTALLLGLVLALLVPGALLWWHGSLMVLQILLFTGWMATGALPLYAVMIPGSLVPPQRVAGTVAMTIAAGEIVGGIGGPIIAGSLADHFGAASPFAFAAGAVLLAILLASFLPARREPTMRT